MHRSPLLQLLEIYGQYWPDDGSTTEQFKEFVRSSPHCFERTFPPGHITASAWIVDAAEQRALLTHHRKLNRWLQCGGHVDGESRVELAALREAKEESGLSRLQFHLRSGALVPLDLDVHPIPARGTEPEHLHYDVRFLLLAGADQGILCSEESNDLAWFSGEELLKATDEESVLRLARRAAEWLSYSRP